MTALRLWDVPLWTVAAILVVGLAACGGGGGTIQNGGDSGGDKPSEGDGQKNDDGGTGAKLSLADKWQQFSDGDPMLELSSREILALYNTSNGRSTHGVEGPSHISDAGNWTRVEDFSGILARDSHDREPVPEEALKDLTFAPVLEHDGVRMIEFDSESRYGDGERDVRSLSEGFFGILEQSGYLLVQSIDCWGPSYGSCDGQLLNDFSDAGTYSETFGYFSGSNPTGIGSATWSGVMTGLDVSAYEPGSRRWILGGASIDIDDLSQPEVDVSFTDIWDVSTGVARSDMIWNDLPLTNGAFNDASSGQSMTISGLFYGPSVEEVGGVFDRDGITGAFGASLHGPPLEPSEPLEPSQPTNPNESLLNETGSQSPAETGDDIDNRIRGKDSHRPDSFVSTAVIKETIDQNFHLFISEPSCEGTRCTFTHPQLGVTQILDIAYATYLAGARPILTKNGITTSDYGDNDEALFAGHFANHYMYGAWMHDSSFVVHQLASQGVSGTLSNLTLYGNVAGNLSGSIPHSLSASWTGIMVGTLLPQSSNAGREPFLQGDAALTFVSDNEGPALDAIFSNIVDLDRLEPHSTSTVRFDKISVSADGTYSWGSERNSINGAFYGPSHTETAGVFEQSGIVGAFGALRQ